MTLATPSRQVRIGLPKLHSGQLEVAASSARFKIVVAGRRWGKTRFGIGRCLEVAGAGGVAWWVAPTYNIAQEGWRPLAYVASQIPGAEVRIAERVVLLPSGGRIAVRTADRSYRLRGAGLDLAVLDEAAFMDESTWKEAIRPALSDRRGDALFITTPKGYNWFHDLWLAADTRPGWARWQKPTSSNPFIHPDEIRDARLELGERLFSQEYLAEFIESGGTRIKRAWFRYAHPVMVPVPIDPARPEETEEVLHYRLKDGELIDSRTLTVEQFVDLAASVKTSSDYTAIATVGFTQERPRRMIVLEVLRARLEGPDILKTLQARSDRWKPTVIHVESSAFQLALVQWARRQGLPVKELRPDRDKEARALPLEARLESEHVWFLAGAEWLPDLEDELLIFPNGKHDDQMDVLAYAALRMVGERAWEAW